ncbi:MAG: tRNA (adenosine(37)-N6)-threonylcarbamoyltransferase complex ATPase subunit type 1 TsaE [Patescibacteria group bacterium]|jgi:tRNA threonylcarbamoyladenosine biosynthesis protein TsaE
MEYKSESLEQTKIIAAEFAATLKGGEVVALEGEIGAGKTTFVQGLAVAFGAEGLARSPTFTVMNVYPATHDHIKKIVHVDAYRLRTPDDLLNLGLEEWVGRPDSIVLIEWPGMVEEAEIKTDRVVRFETGSTETERIITIE